MNQTLDNLDIEYIYHSHNDNCYTEVPDSIATHSAKSTAGRYCCVAGHTNDHTLYQSVTLKSGKSYSYVWICPLCGKILINGNYNTNGTFFGYSWGTYLSMTCGKKEETIESVTIKY